MKGGTTTLNCELLNQDHEPLLFVKLYHYELLNKFLFVLDPSSPKYSMSQNTLTVSVVWQRVNLSVFSGTYCTNLLKYSIPMRISFFKMTMHGNSIEPILETPYAYFYANSFYYLSPYLMK